MTDRWNAMAHRSALVLVILCVAILSISCEDGGDDDSTSFINWANNINGESVVDADNENFKFRSSDGKLYATATDTFYETRVELGGTRIFTGEGKHFGNVVYVGSKSGGCIVAMLGLNGNFLDIQFRSSSIALRTTSKRPAPCN